MATTQAGHRVERPYWARTPTVDSGRQSRGLAVTLVALAAGLLLNTVLGPLVLDVIDYPISPTIENQMIGLELVSVLLVAPLCVVAAVLVARGHVAGAALAIGPAAYAAYMFAQYVVGPDYAAYHPAVLLHLALFVLGVVLAVWVWVRAASQAQPLAKRHRHAHGLALAALAAFILSRYAAGLLGAMSGGSAIPAEFAAEPTFYWSIFLLDLGVVLPGTVAAAVAVWRGSPLAPAALYAVVGWFALVPPSVASMGAVMLARDDPYAAVGQVVVLSSVAVAFAVFAVLVFRPLFVGRDEGRAP